MLNESLLAALSASTENVSARTVAAGLLETWIEKYPRRFGHLRVLGAEVPFWSHLAETPFDSPPRDRCSVWIAGWADVLMTHDPTGAFFPQELKTTSAKTEDDWLRELRRDPQPAIEALCLSEGRWGPTGTRFPQSPDGITRVQVAGITKTSRPAIWPVNPDEGVFEYTPAVLQRLKPALIARAEVILLLRRLQSGGPWQVPGRQCHAFNRDCEYLRHCVPDKDGLIVPVPAGPADQNEKTQKLRAIIESCEGLSKGSLTSPDVVVLSASSYSTGTQCLEKFRISRVSPGKSTQALDVGTAFHAGAAAFHQSLVGKEVK